MKPNAVDYERGHPARGRRGWIRVREIGGYVEPRFPFVCVNCLAPTEERHTILRFRHGPDVLRVGICPECLSRWARDAHRARLRGMLLLLPVAVCGVAVACVKLTSAYERFAASVFVLGFVLGAGGLVVHALAQFLAGPVQVHPVSALFVGFTRSMWIRFRNAAFAEMYLRSEFRPAPTVPPRGPSASAALNGRDGGAEVRDNPPMQRTGGSGIL